MVQRPRLQRAEHFDELGTSTDEAWTAQEQGLLNTLLESMAQPVKMRVQYKLNPKGGHADYQKAEDFPFIDYHCIFQEENAPIHKSDVTMNL